MLNLLGKKKKVVGICPEGWNLNSGSQLQCLSAAEDVGVQALLCLTFFLQALGGFVSILDSVLKYLMLPGNSGGFVSHFGQSVVQNQVCSP